MDKTTWIKFEAAKQQLAKQNLSAEAYEQAVRKLCEEYEV